MSAKKLCRKVVKQPGINSRTGQLLKGWKWENGKPVKAAAKKPAAKKKGLSAPGPGNGNCIRVNANGTRTRYSAHSGSRPCPHGGRKEVEPVSRLNGAKTKTKKKPTAAQLAARKKFAAAVRAGKFKKKAKR